MSARTVPEAPLQEAPPQRDQPPAGATARPLGPDADPGGPELLDDPGRGSGPGAGPAGPASTAVKTAATKAAAPPAAGTTGDAGTDTDPDTDTDDAGTDHPRSRGADARALTQVLFKEFVTLETGTPEHARVRAALIEANLPLVRYAAARFRSRNEPMEDVIQVGTIGLINAIDRFDPDRGVQFPTFAMPTVVGEIKRYFRDNVRTVHVPRRLHELWVQVNGASEDLTVLHGRTPTTAEIAERLRIPEDEVLACIEAGRSYHATSLEAAQEGDGLPGLLDRLGYEDPALAGVEHRDLVRHLLVQLPEREQRILLLRYYSNLTQSQISAELGVSQMHVSRLLSRSFARLRSANRIEA
ncbi:RNA polymerase sigma factor SigF [Streptomyces sp. AA8]|uniref:RNA polymerase sigma factor SigF n=2 Tax=Streptomyces telluris TaxID=2720021 RepID=A0A9X2RLF8_9ACTN|nr:RNA polymerase sigma factor SigF [Streptomyces telluris]MCQ8770892.1 RNA polymerase sigma factor SigF [Streptomyces telluris]